MAVIEVVSPESEGDAVLLTAEVEAEVPKPRARKRLRGTPTHVRSVRLRLTPGEQSFVDTRFAAGRRFYNAMLNEMLARSRRLRADPDFAVAVLLPKGPKGSAAAGARTAAFAALNTRHGFTDYAANSFGSKMRVAWLREHVPAQEAQVLGRRAFTAVRRWHLGLGGKPRFKSWRQELRSMSSNDLNGALHPAVKGGVVVGFQFSRGHVFAFAEPVRSGGRRGRAERAEMAAVHELILTGKVLSCAIVKTVVAGRSTFRANLTVDGLRPQRHPVGDGVVSGDLGPSVLAVVTAKVDADGLLIPTAARLELLAPTLLDSAALLRRMSRRLDRQHRAGSPGCFDPEGRHRRGRCAWTERSRSAQAQQRQIGELHRVRTATRKTSHGQLINELLAVGSTIHLEKLNYQGWQKNWSRSVRDRAPATLVELCRSKAESAGGGTYEYSTFTTALSQMCLCGAKVKKSLSQRTHRCDCGVVAQRDVFSAFLGLYVHRVQDPDLPGTWKDVLDLDSANAAWSQTQDIEWLPGSRSTASHKRQGQGRCSTRSVARIRARRLPPKPDPTESLGTKPPALAHAGAGPSKL